MNNNSLKRILKMAEIIFKSGNMEDLDKFSIQFDIYVKAHFIPDNNGKIPNSWKKNIDYADYENSPYFGSISEFVKKFPGGIKEWLEWRNKTKKDRFKMYDKTASKDEKTIYKLLNKMLEVENIIENQEANDASLKSINDMIDYWKLLLKKKKRRG